MARSLGSCYTHRTPKEELSRRSGDLFVFFSQALQERFQCNSGCELVITLPRYINQAGGFLDILSVVELHHLIFLNTSELKR